MPSRPRTLSILIVAFNEERHLGRLLSAIDRLRRPADVSVRVVVVDGGSRDRTAEAARAGGAEVVVLPGANIPVCRNAGLRASDISEVILVIVTKPHITFAIEGKSHCSVAS